jgi:serpin B
MVYMGARAETADEMHKALQLQLEKGAVASATHALNASLDQLTLANGLWVDKSIYLLADYRHLITSDFQAETATLDFRQPEMATKTINQWIASKTSGLIPSLVMPNDLSESTRLVLTNAVYFKGNWTLAFDPKATKPIPFYPTPETSSSAEMMHVTGSLPYYENDLLQVLALPVKGGSIACLIALPKSTENLSRLERDFSLSIEEWLNNLNLTNIAAAIPKFRTNNRYDLNESLQSLGMEKAFSGSANFAGIDGMRDLFLSKVIHQSYFLIDENGITAAAATGAAMNLTSTGSSTPSTPFVADHPFLFFLVDLKSHLLLFVGKCTQPSSP